MLLIRGALRSGAAVPFPRISVGVGARHVIKRPLTDVGGTHNGKTPTGDPRRRSSMELCTANRILASPSDPDNAISIGNNQQLTTVL